MLVYWILFAIFAAGAVISNPTRSASLGSAGAGAGASAGWRPAPANPHRPVLMLAVLAVVLVIGFRFQVGADWYNYLIIFRSTPAQLSTALGQGDPGYQFLNWIARTQGWDIWFVNLMGGIIFGWGLYRLASVQPLPWLALAVAMPYLILVVAMGYSRQSMALGVIMAGLARQSRGASLLNFAVYVAVAALFHRTAVVAFPLVAISARGSRAVNLLIAVFASVLLYDFFLSDKVNDLVRNYVDAQYASQGAAIRVTMDVVAAALFWWIGKRAGFTPDEYRIWRNFSIASFLAMAALFVSSATTAIDRISLYLIPLQLAVLPRLSLFGENRNSGLVATLLYSFLVQFVWLNFAVHARFWVPYQLYPF